MKKIQPLVLAVTLAVSAIGLTGCGDEGSGNRVGSSAPAAMGAGAKTILIGNVGDQPFERIVLFDQTGNVLASQDIDCKPHQSNCLMYVQSDFNQPVTLVAQDKQGRMLGAMQVEPGQLTRQAFFPSAATTGFYLIDQLEKNYLAKQGVPLQQTVSDLQNFFKSYKGSDRGNIPALLAEFVAKQRAGGQTDPQILEALAKRLKNHETAKTEELPTVRKKLKSNQNGDIALKSGGCSGALGWFMNVVENAADFFPIGSSVMGAAAGIGQFACDDTDSKFAEISAAIAALQASVDTIGNMLSDVKKLQELIEINAGLQRYSVARETVNVATTRYTRFLTTNGVQSLEQFFEKNDKGSFRKTVEEYPLVKTMIDDMYKAIGDTSSIVADHQNGSYFSALKNKCGNGPGGYDKAVNYLAVREWCNTAILGSTGYVISFKESLGMAKDIFNVLAKYTAKEGVNVSNYIGFPVVNKTFNNTAKGKKLISADIEYADYSNAYTLTKKLIETEAELFNQNVRSNIGPDNLFKAYVGLPDGLVENIKKVCPNIAGDGPAVVGWYTPDAKVADDPHFITTRCPSGGAIAFRKDKKVEERPLAKYYYNSNGTNVQNVMGVLIDDDYQYPKYGAYTYAYDNLGGTSHYVAFYSDDLLAFAHQSAVPTDAKLQTFSGALNWYAVLENKTTDANKNYLKYTAHTGTYNYLLYKHTESADSVPEENKIYYHHLVLLTGKPLGWGRSPLFVLNCVSSDCRTDPNNSSGLEFKKTDGKWGGLNIDASYQNKYYGSENNYLYNLGRKKQ